jgi:hypothetical protein
VVTVYLSDLVNLEYKIRCFWPIRYLWSPMQQYADTLQYPHWRRFKLSEAGFAQCSHKDTASLPNAAM